MELLEKVAVNFECMVPEGAGLPVKVLVELRFAHHLITEDCVMVDS